MAHGAPALGRYTSEEYFALVPRGLLEPDDRVELLEGVVVSMAPINPPHAGVTGMVADALRRAFGSGVAIRVQLPLHLDARSAPQPDVAVVPGRHRDYLRAHPTTALVVVEVADTTIAQDRLTKATIYAAASIPQYLIVNLRDRCIEVLTAPDAKTHLYAKRRVARRDRIALVGKPGAFLRVRDLLPPA